MTNVEVKSMGAGEEKTVHHATKRLKILFSSLVPNFFIPSLASTFLYLEALPRLSGVVVSHDHYDMNAFQAYPDKQVSIAVKRGTEKKARRVGFPNVIAMEAWETTAFGPITVTAAPGKPGGPTRPGSDLPLPT
jgi:L-ascorbate metabolism protein UlaG (beta-lactamase superfamily)